jgi:GNAT superfamily N-acetyltransferase
VTPTSAGTASVRARAAVAVDFAPIMRLYSQLNRDDPTDLTARLRATFDEILATESLHLMVLERDGAVVGTTYLNLIPNLTRGGRPYAVIENVVMDQDLRGLGLGKRLMAATLEAAWAAGCYKVMLATGSRRESTHAFYRACGFSSDDKMSYVARPAESVPGRV